MAVSLKILIVYIMFFLLSIVNSSPSTDRDLTLSKNMSVPSVIVDENVVINLLRKRREAALGHGCAIRRIFYFIKCKTFEELEDDFISAKTKTSPYQTTKPKVLKNKHVEDTNVDLSVALLVTPKMATKISTVFLESSSLATQQTTVETELNINVIPLNTVVKSKISDVEAKPISTKVPVKGSSSHVVTDPKFVLKSSNKESKTVVGIEPASVLVINTTTSTPSQVQQEPHVTESNPDLSVIPKAIFMKTKTMSSVSQSNIVREPKVKKNNNMTELGNTTEIFLFKEAGRITFKVEPISVETKQKPTAKQTPFVAESNQIVFQSTTGADKVALGTVDVTSTSAVIDTKIKEIVTSANVEETYEITETNSYPVPKTTPLPTGTTFTEVVSDSSTTVVKSWRIPGSHLLDIFISEFQRLAGVLAVVLLGIGVVLCIRCTCVRKYKKSKKCQYDEEAVK